MVHKKTTYKLNYKNISQLDRKCIWEENSVIREARKFQELSHHSIDEEGYSCECDSTDTSDIEEQETNDTYQKQEIKNEPSSPSKVSHYEDDKKEIITKRHTSDDKKSKDQVKGVLKFSEDRREYDLIPSVGENRPVSTMRTPSDISNYGRSRSMYTLHDRGVINIRPKTKKLNFEVIKHNTNPNMLRSRSTDALFSSGHDPFKLPKSVISMRRTPISAGNANRSTKACKHCGKSVASS